MDENISSITFITLPKLYDFHDEETFFITFFLSKFEI